MNIIWGVFPWVIILIGTIFFIVRYIKSSTSKKITSEEFHKNNIIFSTLKELIEKHMEATKDLSITTNEIKNIFSNNPLRGRLGETKAEELLEAAGLLKNIHYVIQEQQANNRRPDITLLLPKKGKLNVDVKSPYQEYEKLVKAESEDLKRQYELNFKKHLKDRLRGVDNYICQEENTLNFVIVYIPNEMIFSYIYNELYDIWKGALKDRIYICGPLSFIAVASIIRQSYDNFRYTKDLSKILTHIKLFEKEIDKSDDQLNMLGKKIDQVSSEYNTFATTRRRQMKKVIDQIKSEENLIK